MKHFFRGFRCNFHPLSLNYMTYCITVLFQFFSQIAILFQILAMVNRCYFLMVPFIWGALFRPSQTFVFGSVVIQSVVF